MPEIDTSLRHLYANKKAPSQSETTRLRQSRRPHGISTPSGDPFGRLKTRHLGLPDARDSDESLRLEGNQKGRGVGAAPEGGAWL